jgi:hypothetical protein
MASLPSTGAAAVERSDSSRVLCALRLGWAIAEVRGRLKQGPPAKAAEGAAMGRDDHVLPLGRERSWLEQTIETESVAGALAETLGLDVTLDQLTGGGEATTHASAQLKSLAKRLGRSRTAGDGDATKSCWNEVAEFLYAWDANIQDTLASDSFAVASGYQLGRGLAEIYWELDPDDAGDYTASWQRLLGNVRLTALRRLVARLSSYFEPLTATAVAASLSAWAEVARNGSTRDAPDTLAALHTQILVWHDLMITAEPPQSMIGRQSALARAQRLGPVIRAFLPETVLALASTAAAAVAAALFLGGGKNHALAGVLAVLGFFGVSGSGALAKAKDQAHELLGELRIAFSLDLVKEAVTVPPARTFLDTKRRTT